MTTATYSLADFLNDLVRRAAPYTAEGGRSPHRGDPKRLRMTKRQLMHLCYDTLEGFGALDCVWCGVDTAEIGEFPYMIHDDLWEHYGCADGCACIGCLEKSMGRRLQPDDFTTPVPPGGYAWGYPSDRLRDRLGLGTVALFDTTTEAGDTAPQP